jgi:N-hydroxyarylamine O-acetyltransferase
MPDTGGIDLDRYLARIGWSGPLRPMADDLAALHLAHATHIPFENLDILLGRPIRLDLPSLQRKLITDCRGGYCFEQNTLFAAVLERIGFNVTMLAARVRFGVQRVLPRTHALLVVEAAGERWLADVGFGTVGPLLPLPLVPGHAMRQFDWTYRLAVETRDRWLLQRQVADGWQDLYAFTFEPQYAIDIEVANWYVSTHPDSRFVQALIVQRSTEKRRFLLRNHDFTIDEGHAATTRTLSGDDELLAILAEQFELRFPAATRFRILSATDPWSMGL